MLKNTRDPELALWQSAVDEVVAKKSSGASTQDISSGSRIVARPDTTQDLVAAAALDVEGAEKGNQTPMPPPTKSSAEDIGSVAAYCSTLVRKSVTDLVKLNPKAASIDRQQLTAKMGDCDPRWVEPALKYAEFLLKCQPVPYRVYRDLSDFVLPMNDTCRIAIIGDWGTGQDAAKTVLAQMARKNRISRSTSATFIIPAPILKRPTTFTTSGKRCWAIQNHSRWPATTICSAAAARTTICSISWTAGQLFLPAQRQFPNHRSRYRPERPPAGWNPAHLSSGHGSGVAAGQDQDGREAPNILLSHHQLFSAWEAIAGQNVNPKLQAQVQDLLPNVSVWLWGHEHNQVIYGRWAGVLARCIGHGGFPIGATELGPNVKYTEVPIVANTALGIDADGVFMRHGYAIIELTGQDATIAYYDDQDEDTPIYQEKLENQQAAGSPQV